MIPHISIMFYNIAKHSKCFKLRINYLSAPFTQKLTHFLINLWDYKINFHSLDLVWAAGTPSLPSRLFISWLLFCRLGKPEGGDEIDVGDSRGLVPPGCGEELGVEGMRREGLGLCMGDPRRLEKLLQRLSELWRWRTLIMASRSASCACKDFVLK